MAVVGCLIYEINLFPTSFADASITACASMCDVCATYAKRKDDFLASPHAIPTKEMAEEASNLEMTKVEKDATLKTGDACKADVDQMKTVGDLCDVVVSLISNARAANGDTGSSMRSAAILHALVEFDRSSTKIGKN